MSTPMFSLTEDTKGKSLAIFYGDGDSDTIAESHIKFEEVLKQILSGSVTDEVIKELVRVRETIVRKLSAVSERVSIDGTTVYFDGDPLHGEVSNIIRKMFEEGRELDFKPLVNFLEKAKTNPSLKSIDDLYRWIKNGDLVIDPDGFIIAYKGVTTNHAGVPVSIKSGKAFVNGEEIEGQIPNVPGTVISMPRSEVNADEFVHCSYGLHAGTYAYASMFSGGHVILVRINPRDVVSVPNDYNDQKMRVSRYTVLSRIDARIEAPVYTQDTLPDPEEDEDESYFEDEVEEDFSDHEEDYEEEDEEPEAPSVGIRNALGQYTAGSGTLRQRNAQGRFVS